MTNEINNIKAANLNDILENVFQDGFTDDHENVDKFYIPEVILLQIREDKRIDLCAAFPKARYFSVNPFLFANGNVHLLQGSVGGVVDMRNMEDLDMAIREYNRFHTDKLFVVRSNNASMKKARERIAAALA